jgi:predicted RNA-binding protein Jag
MKKEFFSKDVDSAVKKAARYFGIQSAEVKYIKINQEFSRFKEFFVGIVAENEREEKELSSWKQIEKILVHANDEGRYAPVVLGKILELLGFDADIEEDEQEKQILLVVKFKEKLDTRRGEIRELRGAIQYLINRINNEGKEEKRIIIDFGGELEKRKGMIQSLAKEVVEKITEIKNNISICMMDSQDRRIFHTELVEQVDFSTKSAGEGKFRELHIKRQKRNEG